MVHPFRGVWIKPAGMTAEICPIIFGVHSRQIDSIITCLERYGSTQQATLWQGRPADHDLDRLCEHRRTTQETLRRLRIDGTASSSPTVAKSMVKEKNSTGTAPIPTATGPTAICPTGFMMSEPATS